jgi:glycerol uptake facilitator-like aquaporin
MALRRAIAPAEAAAYAVMQTAGAVTGVALANAMFALPLLHASTRARDDAPLWLAESVATFGLVMTILGAARHRPAFLPAAVGLFITAAYWFTASTSFANPAVTLARAMSDSFAGIAPTSVPGFVVAQLAGALAGAAVGGWLFAPARDR